MLNQLAKTLKIFLSTIKTSYKISYKTSFSAEKSAFDRK